jgi:hypothetical protein
MYRGVLDAEYAEYRLFSGNNSALHADRGARR